VRLLRDELGAADAERFLAAANAAPERCLRVNSLRAGVDDAGRQLAAAGFTTSSLPGLPEALLYNGPALERSPLFRAGLVTPQSRGSQLAGLIAAEGVVAREPAAAPCIFDLCAAPGTKTSQLAAALPQAAITAVDVDPARLAALEANLDRMGVAGVETVRADVLELPPAYDGAFDGVLLDAPCSGLGTLGSRPDLRWRRRAADVERLAGLQRRLIERAGRFVRPGGTLTYAVCTLPRAETVGVVRSLLDAGGWDADDLGTEHTAQRHPLLSQALLVLPPDGGATGFFIARLRRRWG
jgi:16S rRNA (cytosine967-C5)-methyltransferase